MRACLEDCFAELEQQLQQIGCDWGDFLWAVQVRSSSSSSSVVCVMWYACCELQLAGTAAAA
jgi:hypothetical protein